MKTKRGFTASALTGVADLQTNQAASIKIHSFEEDKHAPCLHADVFPKPETLMRSFNFLPFKY